MAIERTNRPRNGLAAVYMLAAVTSLSLIPLIVARSGGVENPFLFNAGWRAGVVIGCLGFVFVFYFAQITNRVFWQLIKRRIFDLAILLSIIGNFEYALFTWSTRYLDISVVAILYAVWPIFVILLVARLFDEESRFRRISRSTILLLFVGLAVVRSRWIGWLRSRSHQSSRWDFRGRRIGSCADLGSLARNYPSDHRRRGNIFSRL